MNRRISMMLLVGLALLVPASLSLASDISLDVNVNANATGLVPCTSAIGDQNVGCTLCAGVTLMQNIINFAIAISFPLAAILFAYAGFLYMTSGVDPGGIKKAQEIFTTVFIGFMLVLGGYLIIDLIIHELVIRNNPSYFPGGSWNTIGQCYYSNRPADKSVRDWLGGLFSTSATSQPAGGGGGDNKQCSVDCSGKGLCDASTNSCVADSCNADELGYTSCNKCPQGTWGDYQAGKCVAACTGGQQYDWASGDCKTQQDCTNDKNSVCTNKYWSDTVSTASNGDAQAAAACADKHTTGYNIYTGNCGAYVHDDLTCGGINLNGPITEDNLKKVGYQQVAQGNLPGLPGGYTPQPGDVVHMSSPKGHWEMYSAQGAWISDATQRAFSPYGSNTYSYVILHKP